MAGTPITHFKKLTSSSSRLAPFRECMADYGVGDDPDAEWPNNILSRKTVVYESGVIARLGDPVTHKVDPDELELCRELARKAHRVAKDIEFGLDTESEFSFHPFFIAANIDDRVPQRIDEKLIRVKFGGTIFPPATILIEPLSEEAAWFVKLVKTYEGEEDEGEKDIEQWRSLIRWFRERPEFKDRAFLQIGDYKDYQNARLKKSEFPPGTKMVGSAYPVLALGLTKHGSLAGVCGHIVQT
jgi:hypothetical protein